MKKTCFIITAILAGFLVSCYEEDQLAGELKGKWKITEILGDDNLIMPDSLTQYFEFLACKNAYTATCKMVFSVTSETDPAYGIKSDTLSYTLKSKELDIITPSSTVPNFQSMLRLKRFFIGKLDNTDLEIYRYDDTLTIRAIKI